ncbi:MAG: protoporphyrinogen oxidase HemJ [Rhodobacteraceae bacterium]|nr:protoporphyrinogen oxidase HemJ [Paracoccaceae bacterium]MYF47279.1 protoporphyrinogen oxidase HemJ [Paracoccaceae bacterium]MYI90806.1 protoporphyrinogen oxidase HemJ [Paracoccaceae bacterium]
MLYELYPWIKALHIISFVCWMAGLFYLPRLYFYHVTEGNDPKTGILFTTMETRLLKIITTPAMLATWIFGLILLAIPGVVNLQFSWIWIKLAAVLLLSVFHFWLASKRKELMAGTCRISGRTFKWMNEIPTVLLIVIVLLAVIKPF